MNNIIPLPPKTRGRKTKLNAQVTERICKALRTGTYRKTAAIFGGIGEKTLYTWLSRGDAEKSGPYHNFFEAVQLAEAEGEVALVAIIYAASKLDWRSAAWLLERKYPDRWGRKDALNFSGNMEYWGEVHHVVSDVELSPEVQRALARVTALYYRQIRGGPPEPNIEPEIIGDLDV